MREGISAELVAGRWKLTRDELDTFAVASHQRAATATADGVFAPDLVPVPGTALDRDETIRPGSDIDALAQLRPSFVDDHMLDRFPEIDWCVTAGNSSPLTDGASAALIMSSQKAASLGLRPRARVHSTAVVGDDPVLMLMGVIPATQRILERSGVALRDIERGRGRYGLQTMCEAGGMANATILERL